MHNDDRSLQLLPGGAAWQVPTGWEAIFAQCLYDGATNTFPSREAEALISFVRAEYASKDAAVYPPAQHLFAAFRQTPIERVRVVILGQDPYHEAGQAHGLSFSVPDGVKLPPSLRNIFKELEADLGIPMADRNGDLIPWAKQGVLLLNTVLTVREGEAGSHRRHGWEAFTTAVLQALNDAPTPIAFVLWGKDARAHRPLLTNPDHLVLESEHPSPLSAWRGFFGSRPFSRINDYLRAHGQPPIDFH